MCYIKYISKVNHERHKTVNYSIEKTIASNERGKTVVFKRKNGKKFFWAFISKDGTFTQTSTSGYDTLEQALSIW